MKTLLKKLFGEKSRPLSPREKPSAPKNFRLPKPVAIPSEREFARERLHSLGYSHEFLHESSEYIGNVAE